MENANFIFALIFRLSTLLEELNPYEPLAEEVQFEISRIESEFNRIHRFLFNMTKTLASKGKYPELFLRLDFNGYLGNVLDREFGR
jgi:hypothetical protein